MKWGMFLAIYLGIAVTFPLSALSDETVTTSTFEEAPEPIVTELLHLMLDCAYEQTTRIISTLDDLILYVNRGSIKVKNKDETRKTILKLKRVINDKTNPQQFTPISLEGINTLIDLNTGFAKHLNKALKTQLNNFTVPEPDAFIKRNRLTLDPEDVHAKLLDLVSFITDLKDHAEYAGLSHLNKGYRFLEIANSKFSILPTAFKMACAGAAGVLALYMIPKETLKKIGLSKNGPLMNLKRTLGEKAPNIIKLGGENIVPEADASPSRGVMRGLEDTFGRTGVTFGGLGITLTLKDIFEESIKNFVHKKYEDIKRGVINVHHKLRGSNIQIVDKDKKEIINYQQINNDLIGLEWAKEELESAICYICDPDRYDRYGIPIPKGFLFTGPPGTGKTAFARWMCAEVNHRLEEKGDHKCAGFISVSWYELFSEGGIKTVIEKAKNEAPCIVFIDEIDTVGLQRDRVSMLLNEMLQELSGLNSTTDSKRQIIFIGATNKPEHIDAALRRSGRLGQEILFPLPDFEKRVAYFEHQQKQYAIDPDFFDAHLLAKQTANRSFADLEEVTGQAALAAKQQEHPLGQQHFQAAINKLNGITNSKQLTEKQREILSTYIAGRTAAHILLEVDEVTCATILPRMRSIKEQNVWDKNGQGYAGKDRINFGKIFVYDKQETVPLYSEEDLKIELLVLLAGHAAEKLTFGSAYHTHHKKDMNKALALAMKLEAQGLELQQIPKNVRAEIALKAQHTVEVCRQEIEELLRQHFWLVTALAGELETKSIIYQDEIHNIVRSTDVIA